MGSELAFRGAQASEIREIVTLTPIAPAVTGTSWTGLFAPAGTPPEQVQRIARAVEDASRNHEVHKALAALDMELPNVDSAGFAHLVIAERKRWIPVVRASGFNADK